MPLRIGFLLIDGFGLMSYSAAIEPLRAANLLAGEKLYKLEQIPVSGGRAVSSVGAEVSATTHVGETVDFDVLLVVAGGDPADFDNERVLSWLRVLARRGVRIGGVSGGPFILARAGIMANRRMTVHWEHAQQLMEFMPSALLERSLYVIDRDRMTCAGGAAALDMMHAFIAAEHGEEFARRVSDWFVHTGVRAPSDPQRAGIAERFSETNRAVVVAIQAMHDHVADTLPLSRLAARSGVSTRQLTRLFKIRFGIGPMAFYRDIRLDVARNLVRQAPMSITEIALATGFSNSAHFSQAFRARFAHAPSSERS